jgi:hypothetical protein
MEVNPMPRILVALACLVVLIALGFDSQDMIALVLVLTVLPILLLCRLFDRLDRYVHRQE